MATPKTVAFYTSGFVVLIAYYAHINTSTHQMQIQQNISLKPYNTFGIDVRAKHFATFESSDDLNFIFNQNNLKNLPKMVLGGGSNMLLVRDFEGLILKNNCRGIEIIKVTENEVFVKANGGENWHEFVLWCLEHNFGGVENLSLIPGTVGASPIQNIGAYGVELKDVFYELSTYHIPTQKIEIFNTENCQFGYRESIFKNTEKGNYIILSVTFRLTKNKHHFNLSYGDIQTVLDRKNIKIPTIQAISEAIIEIRSSKLPDPAKIGNSGSFFKNPEIEATQFADLKLKFPNIIGYPLPNGTVKVPAGWLIEQCGWKGKRIGNTGSYAQQALVLVNYGNATGEEIWALALQIQDSVKVKFGILISAEVNVIGR